MDKYPCSDEGQKKLKKKTTFFYILIFEKHVVYIFINKLVQFIPQPFQLFKKTYPNYCPHIVQRS